MRSSERAVLNAPKEREPLDLRPQVGGTKPLVLEGAPDYELTAALRFRRESRQVPTCFDQNSSKSTNFGAIEVVPNRSRGDLAVGATVFTEGKDFSRN